MSDDDIPSWASRARASWSNRGATRPSFAAAPIEGQESVWDYPRPPALVPDARRVRVALGERAIASTTSALRLLETAHPPTFYLPRTDVDMTLLRRKAKVGSRCEWKGSATYFDVVVDERAIDGVAWSYETPFGDYQALAGHIAFYASILECTVDGHRASPQPGGFYGGWVTPELAGPFKGDPGSGSW